jgi:Uma2 family endonuclease
MSATTLPPPPAPAPATTPGLTVEEFVTRYAGTTAELVDGVVKEPIMVWPRHGKIGLRLGALLLAHADTQNVGHVMSNDSWFRTGPRTMRGGDVCYYSYERLPKGPIPEGELTAVPDLVAEVKSPSDLWTELFAKVVEYLRAGVRVVVVIDPATSTVSVYRPDVLQQILGETDVLTLPDVLPGFSVPVARMFA